MKLTWQTYSDEVIKSAQQDGRPILLYLGASWCHWCHVADEQLFKDRAVVKRINAGFVPVRVDADERADLYKLYGAGGLPTFEFLYPNGVPMAGFSGFLPGDQFLKILDDIEEKGKEFAPKHLHVQRDIVVPKMETQELPKQIDMRFRKAFDPFYGGFGTGAKFPEGSTISYAAERFKATQKPFWKEYMFKTVEGMTKGLWDKKNGGFFRYGVRPDWTDPHREKLLEVNADICLGLLFAATVFEEKREAYHNIVQETITFLNTVLWNERVGAYGYSQDADSSKVNTVVLLPANVKMVELLLEAGGELENKEYTKRAQNVSRVLEKMFQTKKGWAHKFDEEREWINWIDDQVAGMRLCVLMGKMRASLNKKCDQTWALIQEKYWDPILLAAAEHPGDEYFDPGVNLALLEALIAWKGNRAKKKEAKGLTQFLATRISGRLLGEQARYATVLRVVPEAYLDMAYDIGFIPQLHEPLKITIRGKATAPQVVELKRWAKHSEITVKHSAWKKKGVEIEACFGEACSGKMASLGELIAFIQFTI